MIRVPDKPWLDGPCEMVGRILKVHVTHSKLSNQHGAVFEFADCLIGFSELCAIRVKTELGLDPDDDLAEATGMSVLVIGTRRTAASGRHYSLFTFRPELLT